MNILFGVLTPGLLCLVDCLRTKEQSFYTNRTPFGQDLDQDCSLLMKTSMGTQARHGQVGEVVDDVWSVLVLPEMVGLSLLKDFFLRCSLSSHSSTFEWYKAFPDPEVASRQINQLLALV